MNKIIAFFFAYERKRHFYELQTNNKNCVLFYFALRFAFSSCLLQFFHACRWSSIHSLVCVLCLCESRLRQCTKCANALPLLGTIQLSHICSLVFCFFFVCHISISISNSQYHHHVRLRSCHCTPRQTSFRGINFQVPVISCFPISIQIAWCAWTNRRRRWLRWRWRRRRRQRWRRRRRLTRNHTNSRWH